MANICKNMENWAIQSSEEWGFHSVVTPETCDCKEAQIYRLNLKSGDSYTLKSGKLEMHPVLCDGASTLSENEKLEGIKMEKYDSFYIPADTSVTITATSDCFYYVAAAISDGIGQTFFRKFDATLPIGDLHQIHGEGTGRREVMFTLAPQDEASRLLCGFTWGGEGTWTSWPPHQHEMDLEEVYCYFDMPKPHFGLHISYLNSGDVETIAAHPVHTGTCVQAPCGYHPTAGSPGTRNTYLWVLAGFSHEQRRYDLAVLDPQRENLSVNRPAFETNESK
ncbi:MAG: 5-deoxy-glucuronate isomerase [Clostridium sp.]